MEDSKKKEILKPRFWLGLIWFAVVIAVMFTVIAPVQAAFGMAGVAITELILFLMGILPAVIFRWNLKEVFPVKLPKAGQIFGTLLLWGGTYLLVLSSTMIIAYFFPEELFKTSAGLGSLFSTVPPAVAFIIIAVMPAICEETLHRGLIRYTFKHVKYKWVTVVAMGIIFGIFHLDPVRFLATAILGAALTYVMVETENLLLPMLMHFVNNALSAISSFSAPDAVNAEVMDATVEQLTSSTLFLGVYCLMAVTAPFLILFGSVLIKPKGENAKPGISSKKVVTAGILSGVIAAAGVALIANGIMNMDFQEILSSYTELP